MSPSAGGRRVTREGLGMPSHAFILSAMLPALAAVARVALHDDVGPWSHLIWLAGLPPIFLLTRYMSWRGALLGLLWTSAMVVLAELFAAAVAGANPDWSIVGLVIAVTASVALGTGLNEQWWEERVPMALTEPPPGISETDGLPTGDVLHYFIVKLFEAARRRPPLTVILLELDRYDDYAGLYGKARVAEAVERVVEALRSRSRASNVLGRLDERTLVVLLQGEGLAAAHALSTRMLEEIGALAVPWSGRITMSTGIAGFEPSLPNSDALIALARQALETARRMGGDRVVVAPGASGETLVTPGMVILLPDGKVKEIRGTV